MAVYFFVVGLEIKRELAVGQLSTFRSAILPVGAAIGGSALRALIQGVQVEGVLAGTGGYERPDGRMVTVNHHVPASSPGRGA